MRFQLKKHLRTAVHVTALLATLSQQACTPEEMAALAAATASSSAASPPDFGDAPDGLEAGYGGTLTAMFPSRLSSDGARHADTSKVALGLVGEDLAWPATVESDATDPADADGVQNIDEPEGASNNDMKDDGLLTLTFADDDYQSLKFSVTAADDAAAGTYYLNALFDWNKDGRWQGADANGAEEWAVKNFAVAVSPGESFTDETDEFLTGLSAHPAWVRLTLSEKPVDAAAFPDGWDGTGEFALGETEDYLLAQHQLLSLEIDEVGLPGVPHNPFNPRPLPPVPGGGGGGGGGSDCDETFFMGATLCEGKSVTKLLTIGGFAPDSISASSDNPGVAGVSLNEANVTVSGNAEGSATITVVATQLGCTYVLYYTVTVKKCQPPRRVMIDCCSPQQIRRDPGLCRNCRIVGRQHNQSNTYGGGGTIPETDMEGRKTDVSKSTVITRGGGLVDVVTVYYECDPCAEEETALAPDDSSEEEYFSPLDHSLFGGENGRIDTWEEYEELRASYDDFYDEASYECATRYFEELFYELEFGSQQ